LTSRQALVESVRARERAALADLAAIAGGQSLCSISRQGATVPAAKYREGAAAALAQSRRAVEAVGDGPASQKPGRVALLEVRARWREQSRIMGQRGPDWTGYLTGGLDALEQMIDDMEDSMSSMPKTDPAVRPAGDPARGPAGDPAVRPAGDPAVRPAGDPAQSGDPASVKAHRRYVNALAAWPLRTRVLVVVLAPLLLILMVAASGGWAPATAPGWTAVVAMVALVGATTLATYLPRPGAGLRPDLGCTPCAAVAAVSVLASFGVLSSSPHDVSTAFLALGISVFGLVQRLNNPSSCPA
jgi:hypothetical protein